MRCWDLRSLEMPAGSRDPIVLHSADGGRAIAIRLNPGQELGDHQVKEHAFLSVIEGRIEIEGEGGDGAVAGEPGMLFFFEPNERRIVSSGDGALLLLVLSPWPGPGHFRGEERG